MIHTKKEAGKYLATCPDCGKTRLITTNSPHRRCLSCGLIKAHERQRKPIIPKGEPFIGETRYGYEIDRKDRKHKFRWSKCQGCGYERWVSYRGNDIRFLCRHCARLKLVKANAPSWNGGRLLRSGYIVEKITPDDFYYPMVDYKGYVLQHRLVMGKYLNRCLLPWEIVHHRNGMRNDNRIENLELLPTKRFHMVDTQIKSLVKRQRAKIKYLESLLYEKHPERRVK